MEITTARLFIIEGQSTYPPTKAHRTEGNEKAKLHETTTFNSFSSCYIAPDAYCDCDRLQTNESYTADSMSEEEEEGRERERETWCFTPSQPLRLYQGGEGGGKSVIIQ